MNHGQISFLPLLIVTLIALIVPFLLNRIRSVRIPVVVGEILCGIILGKSGFNLIHSDQWLDFLSLLGFTYLMFLGGMEIDISRIISSKRPSRSVKFTLSPLQLSTIVLIGTLALSYIAAFYLKKFGMFQIDTHPVMLALILCTTSVGVVLPILKEAGVIEEVYGQLLLLSATIADFATILLATVALVFLSSGDGVSQFAAFMGLASAFYLILYFGMKFAASPIVKRIYHELSHTSAQLRIRTAFAMMLLFAVISQVVGVELVLGAFIAGAIFNFLFQGEGSSSEKKFDAIGYGFLIPIFFIMTGAKMDLSVIFKTQGMISVLLILIVVAFLVKLIPSMVFIPQFGFRNSIAGGFLLSGRLSLIIAFAEVAVAQKLLEPALQPVVLLIAIVTCSASPVLFLKLWKKDISVSRIGVLILGAGKVGCLLAQRLHQQNHFVTLMDIDPDAVLKTQQLGFDAYHGDKFDLNCLKSAGVEKAEFFVAVTGDDMTNIEACRMVRDIFGVGNLVARIGNPDNLAICSKDNIRPMDVTYSAVVSLENIIYRPNVYGTLAHEDATMEVVEVEMRSCEIAGRRLMDIRIPGNSLVMLVQKSGVTSIPHGRTTLDIGDKITLLVSSESISETIHFFNPESADMPSKCTDDLV